MVIEGILELIVIIKKHKYISHTTSTRLKGRPRKTYKTNDLSLSLFKTLGDDRRGIITLLVLTKSMTQNGESPPILHRLVRLEHRFSDRFGPRILTKDVLRATPMRDAHESYYTPRVQYTKSKFL